MGVCMNDDIGSLKLELQAEKHNHRKDNEHYQAEVERLRGLNEYLETRLQDRMVALEDLGAENERLRND